MSIISWYFKKVWYLYKASNIDNTLKPNSSEVDNIKIGTNMNNTKINTNVDNIRTNIGITNNNELKKIEGKVNIIAKKK